MKIIEIFDSIDGEGIRTGQSATFIRLAGCNLRCSYCDTVYSLFGEKEECKYTVMTIDEIIQKLNTSYKRVTLTGGEPLIHSDVNVLIDRLISIGYEVNVETNGAVDITKFRNPLYGKKLFFTIDYKLPTSKMSDKMLWNNFLNLSDNDVIKFVVGSDEDVNVMLDVMEKLHNVYDKMPHIFVGAVYGMFEGKKLVDIILKEPLLKDARYQIQLHKIIWDPEMRGV